MWMLNRLKPVMCLLSALALVGCSSGGGGGNAGIGFYSSAKPTVDTTNLTELEDLGQANEKAFKLKGKEINPIRLQGLTEAGMTLGAQGALAKRSEILNKMLRAKRKEFDQIFDFRALMLKNDVLPPVILEGREVLNLADPNTIRIADKNYKIVQQARFATNPPNWREYLFLEYQKPEVPDNSLLPRKNREMEVKAWKKAVDEGWTQGTQQANQIFINNLARLRRDYNGMILYNKLLNENMISPPMVARTQMGITGGGDDMSINDQLMRITAHPSLNPRGEEWQPAVSREITSITAHPNSGQQPVLTDKSGMSWLPMEETLQSDTEWDPNS